MAFGGIGAAAALVQAASILPPGAYDVNNAGIWLQGQGQAAPLRQFLTQQRASFQSLLVINASLTARVDGTLDGTAADTGILTTAAPAANQHGLPVNWGRGRGRWRNFDLATIIPIIQDNSDVNNDIPADVQNTDDAGGIFPKVDLALVAFVAGPDPAFGDLQWFYKNRQNGESQGVSDFGIADDLILQLHYLNSPNR